MARIAGVNIPTNKRVEVALRYIHGIGPSNAKDICHKVGIARHPGNIPLTTDKLAHGLTLVKTGGPGGALTPRRLARTFIGRY